VAIEGCCHGELDRMYESLRRAQDRSGIVIDLLLCCGNLQAVRNQEDFDCQTCKPEWRAWKDFWKYHSGKKLAPVLTIVIGGHRESPSFLGELYFGGWVAPRIYYLGYAGVVRVGPLRIAGLSGIFRGMDYFQGHHECAPYNEQTLWSVNHTREWDVRRLERLTEPVDIVISHDWPRGIWKFGNMEAMLRDRDDEGSLRREMDSNMLGSPASMDLLKKLRPAFWFSAHLNVKFPALVPHDDGTFTRFLALDKCLRNRDFLQVLDIDPRSPSFLHSLNPPAGEGAVAKGGDKRRAAPRRWGWKGSSEVQRLDYDPEWLAIQKVNHAHLSFSEKNQKATVVAPTKDDISWVVRQLSEKITAVPRSRCDAQRHPGLLPTRLREHCGVTDFRDLSTSQLRELFEARGIEFPGHLDKASLIRQLEEHDEFFAAERNAVAVAPDEAFPIPANFMSDPSNPAEQRRELLEILELEDIWRRREEERQECTKGHVDDNDVGCDEDSEENDDVVLLTDDAYTAAAAGAVCQDPAAGASAEVLVDAGTSMRTGDGDSAADEQAELERGVLPISRAPLGGDSGGDCVAEEASQVAGGDSAGDGEPDLGQPLPTPVAVADSVGDEMDTAAPVTASQAVATVHGGVDDQVDRVVLLRQCNGAVAADGAVDDEVSVELDGVALQTVPAAFSTADDLTDVSMGVSTLGSDASCADEGKADTEAGILTCPVLHDAKMSPDATDPEVDLDAQKTRKGPCNAEHATSDTGDAEMHIMVPAADTSDATEDKENLGVRLALVTTRPGVGGADETKMDIVLHPAGKDATTTIDCVADAEVHVTALQTQCDAMPAREGVVFDNDDIVEPITTRGDRVVTEVNTHRQGGVTAHPVLSETKVAAGDLQHFKDPVTSLPASAAASSTCGLGDEEVVDEDAGVASPLLTFKMSLDFDKLNASAELREEIDAIIKSEVVRSIPNISGESVTIKLKRGSVIVEVFINISTAPVLSNLANATDLTTCIASSLSAIDGIRNVTEAGAVVITNLEIRAVERATDGKAATAGGADVAADFSAPVSACQGKAVGDGIADDELNVVAPVSAEEATTAMDGTADEQVCVAALQMLPGIMSVADGVAVDEVDVVALAPSIDSAAAMFTNTTNETMPVPLAAKDGVVATGSVGVDDIDVEVLQTLCDAMSAAEGSTYHDEMDVAAPAQAVDAAAIIDGNGEHEVCTVSSPMPGDSTTAVSGGNGEPADSVALRPDGVNAVASHDADDDQANISSTPAQPGAASGINDVADDEMHHEAPDFTAASSSGVGDEMHTAAIVADRDLAVTNATARIGLRGPTVAIDGCIEDKSDQVLQPTAMDSATVAPAIGDGEMYAAVNAAPQDAIAAVDAAAFDETELAEDTRVEYAIAAMDSGAAENVDVVALQTACGHASTASSCDVRDQIEDMAPAQAGDSAIAIDDNAEHEAGDVSSPIPCDAAAVSEDTTSHQADIGSHFAHTDNSVAHDVVDKEAEVAATPAPVSATSAQDGTTNHYMYHEARDTMVAMRTVVGDEMDIEEPLANTDAAGATDGADGEPESAAHPVLYSATHATCGGAANGIDQVVPLPAAEDSPNVRDVSHGGADFRADLASRAPIASVGGACNEEIGLATLTRAQDVGAAMDGNADDDINAEALETLFNAMSAADGTSDAGEIDIISLAAERDVAVPIDSNASDAAAPQTLFKRTAAVDCTVGDKSRDAEPTAAVDIDHEEPVVAVTPASRDTTAAMYGHVDARCDLASVAEDMDSASTSSFDDDATVRTRTAPAHDPPSPFHPTIWHCAAADASADLSTSLVVKAATGVDYACVGVMPGEAIGEDIDSSSTSSFDDDATVLGRARTAPACRSPADHSSAVDGADACASARLLRMAVCGSDETEAKAEKLAAEAIAPTTAAEEVEDACTIDAAPAEEAQVGAAVEELEDCCDEEATLEEDREALEVVAVEMEEVASALRGLVDVGDKEVEEEGDEAMDNGADIPAEWPPLTIPSVVDTGFSCATGSVDGVGDKEQDEEVGVDTLGLALLQTVQQTAPACQTDPYALEDPAAGLVVAPSPPPAVPPPRQTRPAKAVAPGGAGKPPPKKKARHKM